MEAATTAGAPARPWLAHYPPGVAHEIDLAGLGTLADLIRGAARDHADRPAFESFGARLTFAQTLAAAEAFGAFLQARGCKPGDRVAFMMPNLLAYPVAMFGALLAGLAVVNVNPLYTARELAHQVADSGAKVLVVLENFAHVAAEARKGAAEARKGAAEARTGAAEARSPFAAGPDTLLELVVVASAGDLMGAKGALVNFVARRVKRVVPPFDLPGHVRFAAALREGARRGFAPVPVGPEDVAFLQYTGGTTGVAKGATLTHRNVAANVAQCRAWFGVGVAGEGAVMITALPLYHVFALTCCCLFMVSTGAACVLIANPRDIDGFVTTLTKTRFTMISGVNTLYNALANHPRASAIDFSGLTLAVAGGMATQGEVARRWKALAGRPIVEGYGLSETSPVVTVNRPDIPEFTGTIGFPMPSTEVVVRDHEGRDLPFGEAGELCVRGPQVMRGYWGRPEETARAMTPDGYFRTGDVAVMAPDGEVRIVDRIKDMILVSGFNVYPNEVEEVLVGHPGVGEAAVVGEPDPRSGEAVVAHVVRRDPGLTEEALRAHAREGLAGYKVPRRFVFREALPKTNVGKVLRRALRDGAG